MTIYLFIKYFFKTRKIDILILSRYFNFILFVALVFGFYLILSLAKSSLEVGEHLTKIEKEFKKYFEL